MTIVTYGWNGEMAQAPGVTLCVIRVSQESLRIS